MCILPTDFSVQGRHTAERSCFGKIWNIADPEHGYRIVLVQVRNNVVELLTCENIYAVSSRHYFTSRERKKEHGSLDIVFGNLALLRCDDVEFFARKGTMFSKYLPV